LKGKRTIPRMAKKMVQSGIPTRTEKIKTKREEVRVIIQKKKRAPETVSQRGEKGDTKVLRVRN